MAETHTRAQVQARHDLLHLRNCLCGTEAKVIAPAPGGVRATHRAMEEGSAAVSKGDLGMSNHDVGSYGTNPYIPTGPKC